MGFVAEIRGMVGRLTGSPDAATLLAANAQQIDRVEAELEAIKAESLTLSPAAIEARVREMMLADIPAGKIVAFQRKAEADRAEAEVEIRRRALLRQDLLTARSDLIERNQVESVAAERRVYASLAIRLAGEMRAAHATATALFECRARMNSLGFEAEAAGWCAVPPSMNGNPLCALDLIEQFETEAARLAATPTTRRAGYRRKDEAAPAPRPAKAPDGRTWEAWAEDQVLGPAEAAKAGREADAARQRAEIAAEQRQHGVQAAQAVTRRIPRRRDPVEISHPGPPGHRAVAIVNDNTDFGLIPLIGLPEGARPQRGDQCWAPAESAEACIRAGTMAPLVNAAEPA